jgi:hypothetical protein
MVFLLLVRLSDFSTFSPYTFVREMNRTFVIFWENAGVDASPAALDLGLVIGDQVMYRFFQENWL